MSIKTNFPSPQVKKTLAAALTGLTLLTLASVSLANEIEGDPVNSVICKESDEFCDSSQTCTTSKGSGLIQCHVGQYKYTDSYYKRTGEYLTKCVAGTGPCSQNASGLCSTYYFSVIAGCNGPVNHLQCFRLKFCQAQ